MGGCTDGVCGELCWEQIPSRNDKLESSEVRWRSEKKGAGLMWLRGKVLQMRRAISAPGM